MNILNNIRHTECLYMTFKYYEMDTDSENVVSIGNDASFPQSIDLIYSNLSVKYKDKDCAF